MLNDNDHLTGKPPRVVAVIPHWNRRDLLRELLASLAAQTRPFDEVIVADNGSTDDSIALAQRSGARVLALGQNLGFAVAVNRAVVASKSDVANQNTDWIAILNNDVTLEPTWLAELLQAAANPQVHFATGKILNAADPSLIDGTFDEISAAACACRCGSGKPDAPIWNQAQPIRIAPMTAALFRRELWEEMEGLDESFGSYLEDVDFGIRCALAGRAGMYVPAAVARHRGSATLGRWNNDTVYLLARNQLLLVQKHFRSQRVWPIVAGQLLWGLLALRHGCGWSWLKGKAAGLRRNRAASPLSASEHSHNPPNNPLGDLLASSEAHLLSLGQETGLDRYWRAYFWLSGR